MFFRAGAVGHEDGAHELAKEARREGDTCAPSSRSKRKDSTRRALPAKTNIQSATSQSKREPPSSGATLFFVLVTRKGHEDVQKRLGGMGIPGRQARGRSGR